MKNNSNSIGKEALKRLRGATPSERILHRLHSVALVLQGFSIKEVAGFYGDSPRVVAYWVERFKASGIEGLEEKPRGRRDRLTPLQMERLRGFVKKNSDRITGPMLSEYIKTSFGVSLTERQCQRIANDTLKEPQE